MRLYDKREVKKGKEVCKADADGNPITYATLFKNNLSVRKYDTCNVAKSFASCRASCIGLPEALSMPSEQVTRKSLNKKEKKVVHEY